MHNFFRSVPTLQTCCCVSNFHPDFHPVVQDSRWVCDVIRASPVDDKAFASMGVQYLVGPVETQPIMSL